MRGLLYRTNQLPRSQDHTVQIKMRDQKKRRILSVSILPVDVVSLRADGTDTTIMEYHALENHPIENRWEEI